MREDVAKMWVEDLRQNADLQGEGALCSDGKFCCLGRLCELALNYIPGLEKKQIEHAWLNHDDLDFNYGVNGSVFDDSILPEVVRQWADLKLCAPIAKIDNIMFSLIALNDGFYMMDESESYSKKNFNEIADIIEKEWPNL